MKAGVGLVVRSKRTVGPVVGLEDDEEPDEEEEDEEPQAARTATASRSVGRGERMAGL
jgi:hypothetical protein